MSLCRLTSLALVLCASQAALSSTFEAAPLFQDRAVLQRDKPVAVWGRAEPGDSVTVEFRDQLKTGLADDSGRWEVRLDPMAASSAPDVLRMVSEKTGSTIVAKDVLVGDVWFCSGQSNMNWSVIQSLNGEKELFEANYPLIRGYRSPLVASAKPEFGNKAVWNVCEPSTEKGMSIVRSWSAVAYYFAREVHKKTGVPIGLIMTSYGGTAIESWMSEEGLKESGLHDAVMGRWADYLAKLPERMALWQERHAKWKEDVAAGKGNSTSEPKPPEGEGTRAQPTALFNAMVSPFMPYTIKGFLWYQGESNAARPGEYEKLFPAMIRQWRSDFSQGDLPFYFVQLAGHEPKDPSGLSWAFLREAQAKALDLPETGMALAIDVGEADNVHPKNKQAVGDRLARIALAKLYGESVAYSGPVIKSAEPRGGEIVLSFEGKPSLVLKGEGKRAFEVAGEDRKFHPGTARIEGETLIVSAPEVPKPVAVRYAWHNFPDVVLYNEYGLPASPFRSDDWSAPVVQQ